MSTIPTVAEDSRAITAKELSPVEMSWAIGIVQGVARDMAKSARNGGDHA